MPQKPVLRLTKAATEEKHNEERLKPLFNEQEDDLDDVEERRISEEIKESRSSLPSLAEPHPLNEELKEIDLSSERIKKVALAKDQFVTARKIWSNYSRAIVQFKSSLKEEDLALAVSLRLIAGDAITSATSFAEHCFDTTDNASKAFALLTEAASKDASADYYVSTAQRCFPILAGTPFEEEAQWIVETSLEAQSFINFLKNLGKLNKIDNEALLEVLQTSEELAISNIPISTWIKKLQEIKKELLKSNDFLAKGAIQKKHDRVIKNFYLQHPHYQNQLLESSSELITKPAHDATPIISLKEFTAAINANPTATRFLVETQQNQTPLLVVSNSRNPLNFFWHNSQEKEKNKVFALHLSNSLCQNYQHYGAEIIASIRQYFLEKQDVVANWSANRIRQAIQEIGEKVEPTIGPLSEIDKDRYPNARLIAKQENANKHKRILKKDWENLYLLIEEEIESSTGQIKNRQRMLANSISARLSKEQDPYTLFEKLNQLIAPQKILSIQQQGPLSYNISFKPSLDGVSTILEACHDLGYSAIFHDTSSTILTNDPYYRQQWNLHSIYGIAAPEAWQVQKSESIGLNSTSLSVAVIDTGVHNQHEDFNHLSFYRGCNFVEDGLPSDTNGHGTHCVGIMSAYRNNRIGIAGIIDDIKIIPCKVSNTGKDISGPFIRDSIDFASLKNTHVINCGLGAELEKDLNRYPEYPQPILLSFLDTLEDMYKQNTILVVAAGNDGNNNDYSNPFPAFFSKLKRQNFDQSTKVLFDPSFNGNNVVVVAATDEKGQIANSSKLRSNYGKETVHLGAPGVDIWSTYVRKKWTLGFFRKKDNAYESLSGTSMAAPHVTAALSMMKLVFPLVSAKDLIDRLLATTDPIPTLDQNHNIVLNAHTIAGRLNLAHALRKDLLGTFGVSSGSLNSLSSKQNESSLLAQMTINSSATFQTCADEVESLNLEQNKLSQALITLRHNAEEKAIIASFAKEQLKAVNTTFEVARWSQETIFHALHTKALWEKAIEKSRLGFEKAPIAFKDWWQQELKYSESQFNDWNRKLAEWDKMN